MSSLGHKQVPYDVAPTLDRKPSNIRVGAVMLSMPEAGEHKLKTAQIGRCGELLVQYRLLSHGIESSSMTTDSGVDLVAILQGPNGP